MYKLYAVIDVPSGKVCAPSDHGEPVENRTVVYSSIGAAKRAMKQGFNRKGERKVIQLLVDPKSDISN
jgi:hypothetical protein